MKSKFYKKITNGKHHCYVEHGMIPVMFINGGIVNQVYTPDLETAITVAVKTDGTYLHPVKGKWI